jgi:hypothetical protein
MGATYHIIMQSLVFFFLTFDRNSVNFTEVLIDTANKPDLLILLNPPLKVVFEMEFVATETTFIVS